jgi:hypothetical protein
MAAPKAGNNPHRVTAVARIMTQRWERSGAFSRDQEMGLLAAQLKAPLLL